MDKYVMLLSFCPRLSECLEDFKPLEKVKQLYHGLRGISCDESPRVSAFPACSLSGYPSGQRWFFAIEAVHGFGQYCSSEWEEGRASQPKGDREEESPSAWQLCHSSLQDQGREGETQDEQSALAELFEEAAEGLHLLSDKLPPPGKALVDVLVLCGSPPPTSLRDLLPLMGALKHMECWHSAKITLVTPHAEGWQRVASSLSATVVGPAEMDSCIDHKEQWRGALLIRERKCASELRFGGFSLRTAEGDGPTMCSSSGPAAQRLQPQVFHYYRNVLDLMQMVSLKELPDFLLSNTEFQLRMSGKSKKCKLLLDQLSSLRGEVGALFCLSCVVTPMAQPVASQLSSQRWRDTLAKRPSSLPVPEVEVKGEGAHYFLLVQGSEDGGGGACRARMLHSANQINGAAAVATVNGLLREKSLLSSGKTEGRLLDSLPCFRRDDVRQASRAQTLVLKECLKRRVDAHSTAAIPVSLIKTLLNRAAEQYLRVTTDPSPPEDHQGSVTTAPETRRGAGQPSEWPERSVLRNVENLRRRRQKNRFGPLSAPGSSDSLLGPKDASQRVSAALLDAKELLKHFCADGTPAGELQPLVVCRGSNVFQMSPDLSPGRASQLPFSKASATNYHGIEFCLDQQQLSALDRDLGFVRLQSRLVRFETQTTCSKEPLPFALSPAPLGPAPSPAVASEPGSVPDGEALLQLQNANVARLKRRSREADAAALGGPRKRLVKSESCDSLCSQSSGSSGTRPSVRSLRQQPIRSQSTSASTLPSSLAPPPSRPSSGQPPAAPADTTGPDHQGPLQVHSQEQQAKESRSQKHHRMLKEVVAKTLEAHDVTAKHPCFSACSKRLFEISKFYLKDLKTSRGLHDEMKKAAKSNAKQVIDWELEKTSKKQKAGK
ncbi:mdm2-binding protein [Gadus chalcogrammus]|uniref:mdm2-binding protein n=1 Tax=Gadus chalcogrammus TaxID=1042646 RepID=UPI0024C49CA8|nr:mdm2-binding protein [Gadus chalcogrammus]